MTSLMLVLAVTAAVSSADLTLYQQLCEQVAAAHDDTRGGFVGRGHEPHSGAVELALQLGRAGDATWRKQALETIDWTWSLYDSVGGGFMTRADDANKSMPRFEKRTDVNARRLENLLDAYTLTGEKVYRVRAGQIVDYFERVLLDGRGGFAQGQFGGLLMFGEANGYAVHAYLRYAAMFDDKRRVQFALKSLDRVWAMAWDDDLGIVRRDELGDIMTAPRLVDQVEFGRACLRAARIAKRKQDLQRAITLGRMVVERYEDPKKYGFYTKGVPDPKTNRAKKAKRLLEENARASLFLCELSQHTGDPRYRDAARRAWESFGDKLLKQKLDAADWALAVQASFDTPGVASSTPAGASSR